METKKEYDLKITTKTWDKDNHILIDYENQNITKKTFKINSSGFLSRINDKIIFSKENHTSQKLLEIIKNEENNKYKINCGNWSKDLLALSNERGAYIIYKSDFFKEEKRIGNKYYKLNQGDILKLGRIYIKLLDMQLAEENNSEENENINIDISSHNENKRLSRDSSLHIYNSLNSSIFKGQEIIRGTFINDKKQNRNYNLSKIYNLKNEKRNCLLLSCDNKYKNRYDSINNNLKQYNNLFLPRINSCGELFMIKPITKLIIGNKNKKLKKGKKYYCRICYGDYSLKENPLISPCECKGSMKYIHYLCLKNYLNSKIETEIESNFNKNTITYNKKAICCDICRSQFPDYIRYNGILYNISFYKPKFKEFIMFEILKDNQDEKTKYISIVSLDNKNIINIGRSKDCEFSISEISLSRFHSIIYKDKNELYIEDNKSKFGTLILVQNDNIELNKNIPLKLQIDRTYIKIKIDTPIIYFCCNAETNTYEEDLLDYQNQNKLFLNVFSYFNIKDNTDNDIDFENNSDEEENNPININQDNKSNIINLKENKIILSQNEDNETNEKNNFEKKYFQKINNVKLNRQKEKNDIFKNKNNEILNNIQLYKRNNMDTNFKSFDTNNISNISKTRFADSNLNTPFVNDKKCNINLMIEDCNNKIMMRNDFRNQHTLIKLKKKIKIRKSQKYLISNKEYLFPKIKNDVKPFSKALSSSININDFQSIKNKFNSFFINESDINNNIFNLNKNKPKIINKHSVLNSFINSNKI